MARMNERVTVNHSHAFPKFGIFVGVFWALWGPYGFWWALLYAAFWPVWFGFRLAKWLATGDF